MNDARMVGGQLGWVVVTGASAGIGKATVRLLRDAGFSVVACVLEKESEATLGPERGPMFEVVRFDVADGTSRAAGAARIVEIASGHGLAGLVNNAGVAVVGPVESLPLEQLRRQFEVNFFGAVALTQLLLPELLLARGRVINISSMFGRMSLPFSWPYCASKHALEAFSAGLRMELSQTGVRVVTIRPGSVRTSIWEATLSNLDSLFWGLPGPRRTKYFKMLERTSRAGTGSGERGVPPDAVARVVVRALTAAHPRAVYRVGRDARGFAFGQRLLSEAMWERLTLWRLHAHKTE